MISYVLVARNDVDFKGKTGGERGWWDVGSRRLIRGQIYLYSSRARRAKASQGGTGHGSAALEYVYAERGGSARVFQVTPKRLTKIFKRDAGGARHGDCCLFAFVASRDNGKRKPDAARHPSLLLLFLLLLLLLLLLAEVFSLPLRQNRANSLLLFVSIFPLFFFSSFTGGERERERVDSSQGLNIWRTS